MPSYSGAPYQLRVDEFLKGKSWFHWCPNTHLHSRRRMYRLYEHKVDSWGKPYDILQGWYCTECGLLEIKGWED